MNRGIKLLMILVSVLMSGSVLARNARKSWQDDAESRRADYIYMEAQRQRSLDNNDAYYELLKRAQALNSSETILGHELGFYKLMLSQGNDQMSDEGLEMLKTYFDEHPEDYYSSIFYGSICERLGLNARAREVWSKLHEIFPNKVDVAMRLADAYLAQTGDDNAQTEARRLLDEISKSEGRSLPLTARSVMSYMSSRDTAMAVNEIETLVKEMPRSPEARVYAGDVYQSMGNRVKALQYYNEACEVDPSSGLAYYKRAGYYKEIGDSAAYDREVLRALELPDLELDTKLEIFTGFVKEQYNDSLMQPRINELFGKLIDMYPHEPDVYDLYCSYFVAIDDYASAAEQQEYVIDSDISNEDRWRALISLYFSAQQYGNAADRAKKASQLFPRSAIFKLLAGEANTIEGNYDEALKLYDECLATDTVDMELRSKALTARGDALYKQGFVNEAITSYEEALIANPSNAMAMNNCAYFMACEGMDLDRAAELSRRSLNLAPDNDSSLDTYAWIMFKKGDYKEAKVFIDKAMELTEEPSAELYQHMGDIYFMCGEPDEALEYWKKGAELDPNDDLLQRKIKHKTYFYK